MHAFIPTLDRFGNGSVQYRIQCVTRRHLTDC